MSGGVSWHVLRSISYCEVTLLDSSATSRPFRCYQQQSLIEMEMIKGTLSRKVTQPGWTNFFGCRFPIISRWSTTGNRHIIQNACSAVMEENLSFAGSQHTRGQDYNRLSSQTLADLVCQSKANEMVIQYHRRVTMTVFHLQQRRE